MPNVLQVVILRRTNLACGRMRFFHTDKRCHGCRWPDEMEFQIRDATKGKGGVANDEFEDCYFVRYFFPKSCFHLHDLFVSSYPSLSLSLSLSLWFIICFFVYVWLVTKLYFRYSGTPAAKWFRSTFRPATCLCRSTKENSNTMETAGEFTSSSFGLPSLSCFINLPARSDTDSQILLCCDDWSRFWYFVCILCFPLWRGKLKRSSRRRGRPHKSLKDNIKEWRGQSLSSLLRIAYDRSRWPVITAGMSVGVPQRRVSVTGISSYFS